MISRRKMVTGVLATVALGSATFPDIGNASTKHVLKMGIGNALPPYSYGEGVVCTGTTPDAVKLAFSLSDKLRKQFAIECTAYPWKRAQNYMKGDRLDMFCTYPSKSRREYANFCENPIYGANFAGIVYDKLHPNAQEIANIKSFNDMRLFKLVAKIGAGWEAENLPNYLERIMVQDTEEVVINTFSRREGDIFVKGEQQAAYYGQLFGIEDRIGFVPAGFIPNNIVNWHVGIRKNFEGNEEILQEVDRVIKTTGFKEKFAELIGRYSL